jgi:hypothetical protein
MTVTEGIALSPGRHALVTSHLVESFEMVNPAESFAYRKVTSRLMDDNLRAYTAEFSMTKTIAEIKQLRDLVSSDHPEAERIAKHMLKTAAILSQIGGTGAYQQYQHPHVTAAAIVN